MNGDFPVLRFFGHMLRHSTGYALAANGMDTRRLQHFLGHASITNTVRYTTPQCRPNRSRTYGAARATPQSPTEHRWCVRARWMVNAR